MRDAAWRTNTPVAAYLIAGIPLLVGVVTHVANIARIWTRQSTAGTSAVSVLVTMISCVAWLTWAWQNHYPALAWVNFLWLTTLSAPLLAVMAWVRPLQWGSYPLIPAWAGILIACWAVTSLTPVDLPGAALSLSGLLWLAPAAREVFRHRDISGVSLIGWAGAGVDALAWSGYGIYSGAWAGIAYGAVQIVVIGATIARIIWIRTRPGGTEPTAPE